MDRRELEIVPIRSTWKLLLSDFFTHEIREKDALGCLALTSEKNAKEILAYGATNTSANSGRTDREMEYLISQTLSACLDNIDFAKNGVECRPVANKIWVEIKALEETGRRG